jgi:hypothetical protein
VENEGHPVRVFVDTGAYCNTISRKFYETLVSQGLECVFHPGPTEGFNINLGNRCYTLVTELLSRPKLEQIWENFLSGQDFFWFWTIKLKIWLWGYNGTIRS